ncbi:MAG: hypothetical protein ABSB12_02255 [Candidatus Saccharimonadales bacterium]|jgi:hypothetical protein
MTNQTNADIVAITPEPTWVQFVVLGGDVKVFDYEPGMTVQNVLKQAEAFVEQGQVITVNGEPARLDQVVEAGSVVQLTGRVKNG